MRPAKQSIAITMGLFKNTIMFNYLICSPFCVTVPNHICDDAITEEKYASVENVVISFSVELAHFSPRSSGGSRSINGHIAMLRHWNSLLMVIRTHQSQLRPLLLCFKTMSTRKIKQNFKSNICNVALPVHLQHVWLKPQTLSVDVSITAVWWSAVRGLKFVAYCFETAFEVTRLGSFYIWLCGCLSNKEDSLKPRAHEWLAQLMILSIWPFGVTNGNMGSKIRKKKKEEEKIRLKLQCHELHYYCT